MAITSRGRRLPAADEGRVPCRDHSASGGHDFYLDQAWILPIVQNPEHVVARANLRSFRYNGQQALDLAELWLS